jgi:hypothetical protein
MDITGKDQCRGLDIQPLRQPGAHRVDGRARRLPPRGDADRSELELQWLDGHRG